MIKKYRDVNIKIDEYLQKSSEYLNTLCSVKPNRRTGSIGNRAATDFFYETVKTWGYEIDTKSFSCLDFERGEASLACNGNFFEIYISPYSLGCDISTELVTISTIGELEKCHCTRMILLM